MLQAATVKPKEIHRPQAFLDSIEDKKNPGELIYQDFCALCHAEKPMIKLNAPRIGVKADWKEPLKQTIDEMLERIDEGLGAMPPRGGCFECTDQQLKAAIIYMLPKKSN